MSLPSVPIHHVFVDFENVPSVDLTLIGELPVLVTLLIGKTQTKLETPLVEQIHAHAAKVRLVTLGASGRNALDLTLAYYLGRAVAESEGAELHIVSKDKDFEPLMAHLRSKNLKISRAESFAALSFLPAAPPVATGRKATGTERKAAAVKKPVEDRSAKVIARLKHPGNRNRPASEGALLAHIRTALGKEVSAEKTAEILRQLQDEGILTVQTNGRVTYEPA